MANTNAIWQHAAHTPTNYNLPVCTQETYQKAYLLAKNNDEFSGKKSQEDGPVGRKKDKTERAIGVGRRTREKIVKHT